MFGWRNGVLMPRGFRLSRSGVAERSLALDAVRATSSSAIGEAACTSEPDAARKDPIVVSGL
jgi:hypothetical protein